MRSNFYDLSFPELNNLVVSLKEPGYRAKQIWQGIYQNLWLEFNDFSNLPQPLREQLDKALHLEGLQEEDVLISSDGQTRKFLYR